MATPPERGPMSTGRVVRPASTPERYVPLGPSPSRQRQLWIRLTSLAGLSRRTATVAQLTRAAVGAQLVAFVCGLVGADYVGSAYFSIILPGLSGLACAWIVSRGASGLTRATRDAVSAVYGAASAAVAFVYSDTPYGHVGSWLPPVIAGVVGAALWPFVDPAPPGLRPVVKV